MADKLNETRIRLGSDILQPISSEEKALSPERKSTDEIKQMFDVIGQDRPALDEFHDTIANLLNETNNLLRRTKKLEVEMEECDKKNSELRNFFQSCLPHTRCEPSCSTSPLSPHNGH